MSSPTPRPQLAEPAAAKWCSAWGTEFCHEGVQHSEGK
jgi:hypothetical protein